MNARKIAEEVRQRGHEVLVRVCSMACDVNRCVTDNGCIQSEAQEQYSFVQTIRVTDVLRTLRSM